MTTTLLHIHVVFQNFGIYNTKSPDSFSSELLERWIPNYRNVEPRTAEMLNSERVGKWQAPLLDPVHVTLSRDPILFLHLFLGFLVSGLRNIRLQQSFPLRTTGIRNTEVPNLETPVFHSKMGSTTHSLSWSDVLCIFRISHVKSFKLLHFGFLIDEMPKSSFREFPRNLDCSPRVLLLDGHDPFEILWAKSPDSLPLYISVDEIPK